MGAEALLRLIAHVERKLESETPAEPSYAREWLDWARIEAAKLDPTSESLDEFFDHYRGSIGRYHLTISMTTSDVTPSILAFDEERVIPGD
jgi:hypothetical protein